MAALRAALSAGAVNSRSDCRRLASPWRRLVCVFAAGVMVICPVIYASAAGASGSGRAWELVTPKAPMAGIVFGPMGLSADGDRIAYLSVGPVAGAPSGDILGSAIASRGLDGWSNTPLGTPYTPSNEFSLAPRMPAAFSSNLETVVWLSTVPLAPGAPAEGEFGIHRQQSNGPMTPLFNVGESEPELVRASADSTELFFATSSHLLPADSGRISGLSLYSWKAGVLSLVDTDNSGKLLSECGSEVASNGISHSLNRVFFTARSTENPENSCGGISRVYLREKGHTVEVSASRCTREDCNSQQSASFVGATPDGSRAFVVTSQQLINDDRDELPDLYRYDADDGALTLVSASSDTFDASVFAEAVAFSVDGSRVYFFAAGRLIPQLGSEAGPNLYLADEEGLHFLASLPSIAQMDVDSGGSSILLATEAALDNEDSDEHADIYRYDIASRAFVRLSQGNKGGNGPYNATIERPEALTNAASTLPGNALSSTGRYAFFTTKERLNADDHNDYLDVYEWSAGKTHLISGGTGMSDSTFAAATPDGVSVFFRTADTLLSTDQDGGDYDFYAARLGGGFKEETPTTDCGDGPLCTPLIRNSLRHLVLRSLGPHPKQKLHHLRILKVKPSLVSQIIESRKAVLTVLLPEPGLVRARALVRIKGKSHIVGSGTGAAVRPGLARVVLHFRSTVRNALSGGQKIVLSYVVRQGRLQATHVAHLRWDHRR